MTKRTTKSRRFPAVYRGPDLTDGSADLSGYSADEIEDLLNASKLTDEELQAINIGEIAADVENLDLIGNDPDASGTIGKVDAIEVN